MNEQISLGGRRASGFALGEEVCQTTTSRSWLLFGVGILFGIGAAEAYRGYRRRPG